MRIQAGPSGSIYILIFIVGYLLSDCKPKNTYVPPWELPPSFEELTLEERLKPENSLATFELHEGLEASLFASEPMVVNPTNIDIDSRGRVWVLESYNYGVPSDKQEEVGGKISILEDTDGDGKADKKTVFYQGEDVNIAIGICVLGNRIYVSRSPNLLVFTDENGDDVPDKKEVLFTGTGGPGDHSLHTFVFGPDGYLYFNHGNAVRKIEDADENVLVDRWGAEVRADGNPYHGGMIYRCLPDGSEIEVLAHNFRNNYEVAVDSYGNIWQSDNDDDGYKSCRINYILEYGNYGYLDEYTGAHWSAPRTGMSADTTLRHWHQNDPGSIPNLLNTGSGSPAGITFYEGNLLPDVFHNSMIHTEALHYVVRAYPIEKKGAGYKARIVDILRSNADQWFRPVDVCVAPDGSLMVADWYDPGVGGGAAADSERGRIYRIAPEGHVYNPGEIDNWNVTTAVDALENPNMARRYMAWQYLSDLGSDAEKPLQPLLKGDNPILKARATWLLGKIPGLGEKYLHQSIEDRNEDIRILGVRLARQLGLFDEVLPQLIDDPSAQVRRELLIGLRHSQSTDKPKYWAQLAEKYEARDRWCLEALGLAEDLCGEDCFEAWLSSVRLDLDHPAHREIIWRSRSTAAMPLLAEIINRPSTDTEEIPRFFRAFDFHKDPSKQRVLMGLLQTSNVNKEEIVALVLQHIDPDKVAMTPALEKALKQTLDRVAGTQEFINIVDKFGLVGYREALLTLTTETADDFVRANALKLLVDDDRFEADQRILSLIREQPAIGDIVIPVLGSIGNKPALDMLSSIIRNKAMTPNNRKAAVQAMGKSWWGEDILLGLVKEPGFEESLKPVAAAVLFTVYRIELREEAANYLDKPGGDSDVELMPVRDLVSTTGDPVRGAEVFEAQCLICHRVGGAGIAFGPDLSAIGNKLSKEGLYRSIIFPSEGINNGYETYQLTLKDGGMVVGLKVSETEDQVTMKMVGGLEQKYRKSDIEALEMLDNSLMTNLIGIIDQQQLIDLVEYLGNLK